METKNVIENKRVYLTPENLKELKDARDLYSLLIEKFPVVIGITFCGSRMLSLNENNESDLDCFLFYDGSVDFEYKYKKSEYNESLDIFEEVEKVSFLNKNEKENIIFEDLLRQNLAALANKKNFKYEMHRAADVSDEAIKNLINKLETGELSRFKEGKITTSYAFKYVSLFLFGFGTRLLERRKFFLDELSKKEKSDDIWMDLREAICFLERKGKTKKRIDVVDYENYPKTIEEAKKFFSADINNFELYEKKYFNIK